MNNPFTVSLEGIGQCMLHPGLLFCLQPSPHTINYSCPLTTTSSWAGKHWGPSLPQCCSYFKGQKLPATAPASAVSPTQHTHDIQVPRSLACLGCLHYRCQWNCYCFVFHKVLPMLPRMRSTLGWPRCSALPGQLLLLHHHLQSALSLGPERNSFCSDFMFSPFLFPWWDGSLMLF